MTHVLECLVSRLLIVCGYILMGGAYITHVYILESLVPLPGAEVCSGGAYITELCFQMLSDSITIVSPS